MFKVLRPLDIACVGIVTMAASTSVTNSLGLSDAASVIALTMGLTCPAARRLIAWRRGVEAIRIGTGTVSTGVVVCAMLPWMLLPMMDHMPWESVASLATMRVALPEMVRWAGVALTIIGVLRPMLATLRGTGRIRSTAYVETLGLFVATGSAFLGVLAVAWIVAQSTTSAAAIQAGDSTLAPAPAAAA
jgi:hypothetical protein